MPGLAQANEISRAEPFFNQAEFYRPERPLSRLGLTETNKVLGWFQCGRYDPPTVERHSKPLVFSSLLFKFIKQSLKI
jgi:hypothetical protein